MAAAGTAVIMMHHDALSDIRDFIYHSGASCHNDTCRLVSANNGWLPPLRPSVLMQIATAHARGFYLNDNFTWPWHRVRKISKFYFFLSAEDNAVHFANSSGLKFISGILS
jgi:hypothetical protein